MNTTKLFAYLPALLISTFLLVGCTATGITPSTVSGLDVGSLIRLPDLAETSTVPGFYFSDSWIYEYARSAAGNTPPLRQLITRGLFFGADKYGNVYSYTDRSGNECLNPCEVIRSDALGKQHHEVTLPTLGLSSAYHPSSLFVDQNGSIYYMLFCRLIVQLPAGATGINPKPVRAISVPSGSCPGNRLQINNQLFAASNGNLFMNGSYRSTAAYYNWSAAASGKAKPRVTITSIARSPILGIDSKGGAWTIGRYNFPLAAYRIGPNQSGRINPSPLALQGIDENTLLMLRVSSKDQLVYEGLLGSNRAVLRISSLGGGKPTRLLNLPQGFVGDELISITF